MPVYRSKTSTAGRNMAGARALWRATGMKDDDFSKPIIAISNSFTQFVPGQSPEMAASASARSEGSPMAQVKHNRTFKKYTDECRPDLVEAAREYAASHSLAVYEDASIVKITASQDEILTMCDGLRESYGPLPGDEEPKEK